MSTLSSQLTIRALRARPVKVPMRRPLVTGGGTVAVVPLVLIDLECDQGITGASYLFTYTPLALEPVTRLLASLADLLRDDPLAPHDLEQKLQTRFRLLGLSGVVGMALAGIDMAAWDALARAHGLPLVSLLGGRPRPVHAYNSCGLGLIGPDRAAAEAAELAEPGFDAVKVRLGYPDPATDLAVLRAVRSAVGPGVSLMTDYNQCLTAAEALHRVHRIEAEMDLLWVEEPTRADDDAGHAAIRRDARTPIQIGENWWGTHEMARSLAAGASDLGMPDAMKIGGVSGWLRAAALAEPTGFPLSSHLFPEISAHLLAVTPTAHWLEYVDWAEPILQGPPKLERGHYLIPDSPGVGLAWNEDAVTRYLAG
ncbi:MAG TPA: enolase C-terminal domain-like protein [Bryobacteraceae bacterium]|nr:enolase C-terminal domain-like protein [Bryobacteraceae bacterium]